MLLIKLWHKRCFSCSECHRHLDSFTVNDGPDGEIYCKACYGAKFGVHSYGMKKKGEEGLITEVKVKCICKSSTNNSTVILKNM